MENTEFEENLFAIGDPKLHGDMCKKLVTIYCKVFAIFPDLEAARPRSTTGIQALCNLHMALEKSKNLFQHCSECSKLYLAITGDSVVLKFEKARCALEDSLRQVMDIVPQVISSQISDILSELSGIEFSLDPSEKQIGDDMIALLQQGKKFNSNCSDNNELESFHQAASRLGITSSRAALRERRALKKVIEKARVDDDKRKESIVAYLLHLMRKYSKLFRSDLSDDNDSQGSTPCSPTVQGSPFQDNGGSNTRGFDRQISKFSSFNFRPNFRRSEQASVAPEELRCPISLQLMYDPVIISSGQTYERVCIEKWFSDGHNTCPKSQQNLPHLSLTPNYCVKGLVASWCEQNCVPTPDGPPDSLDLNYWRLSLSEKESTNSKSIDSIGSFKTKGVKIVPIEESCITEEVEGNEVDDMEVKEEECGLNMVERYDGFLVVLDRESDLKKKMRVVERIRHLLKDDEEARIYMGANGFVDALIRFLGSAVEECNEVAQENGAMALFNLAVNNNRNKEMMLAAGVFPLLEEMISKSNSQGSTTALYLNLSCLDEAKPIIGSSSIALPFLINTLLSENDPQTKLDSLHTLFNLSTSPPNIPHLLSAKIIEGLLFLITDSGDHSWTEKSIAVLINMAACKTARDEMTKTPSLISGLATILDVGEPIEQEQSAACLFILCNGNEACSQMLLQEGVIPSLVSISVNGTMRGKQKAQKLLMLFREQRQQESVVPVQTVYRPAKNADVDSPVTDAKPPPLFKSSSTRRIKRNLSFWWKNKSFAVYQC